MAAKEGWMAEHMLVLGLEDPTGKVTYMGAAFPSACGKTNMAMMVSALEGMGYRVWTVGDDIAWMKVGPDGYLHAINPEAGFFGVAPGTAVKTNPNVMRAICKNSIFTNVAMTPAGEPWWEGSEIPPPPGLIDWQGRNVGCSERSGGASQCALYSSGAAITQHFAALARSGRRAHFRVPVWRKARASGASCLRII